MKKNKILIIGILVFLISSIIIIALPVLLTKNSVISLGVDSPNAIGDTLGGIMGPFVGLLAAFLTFLAFWAQYEANQKVQEQFKKQELSSKLYHYHDLINNAREKINNFSNTRTDKTFEGVFKEFKVVLDLVVKLEKVFLTIHKHKKLLDYNLLNNKKDNIFISMKRYFECIEISWILCFNGFKEDETLPEKKILKIHDALGYNLIVYDKDSYKSLSNDDYLYYRTAHNSLSKILDLKISLSQYFGNIITINNLNKHKLYGNFNTLSPYFQLYFQAIKLLNESDILDYYEKYEFAKMFRAEMTKDEIYVFFINSLSEYGHEWELKHKGDNINIESIAKENANRCLITKYNILKHINDEPELDIDVKKLYPDLIFSSDTDSERDVKKAYRSSIFK
jgi:hypothetical protein